MGNAINEVADYSAQIPAGIAPAEVQRAVLGNIVPALRAIPGVQFVHVYGAGDEALWIQPDLDAMQRHGVAVTALAQAVKAQVLLEPAGFVTLGHNDVLIEARSLPVHIAQLEQIPVPTSNGPVPLRALAKIVRSAMPTHNAVALDGRPSVALTVIKQPGASTLAVTRAVQATLDGSAVQLPPGVRWVRTYSQGHVVRIVGADLGRNLLIGAVLAVLVLFWVLGAGRGIVTLALSIPLSLALGIAALHALGQDLNLMTLGALTVAVGLLADDAIIVLESIYHRWESGDAHWAGVWNGLKAIAIPDVTGTLTNVAIYVPLLFVGGLVGLFFIPFSLAMILALLASLIVSLTLTPLGLGFLNAKPASGTSSGHRALQHLQRWNEKLFDWVSHAPRTSLAVTFAVLALSLAGLILVPIDFLPLPNEGVLLESFTLPPGSALLDARQAVGSITQRLLRDAHGNRSAAAGGCETARHAHSKRRRIVAVILRAHPERTSRGNRQQRLPGVSLFAVGRLHGSDGACNGRLDRFGSMSLCELCLSGLHAGTRGGELAHGSVDGLPSRQVGGELAARRCERMRGRIEMRLRAL
jgi:cobalt-zinc-cadmium resistance protein CzcA